MNREQREEIVKNYTLDQAKEKAVEGLRSESPVSSDTVFFMTLANILAAEAGIRRLVNEQQVSETDFTYVNMTSLTAMHRDQLIEHGKIIS